MGVSLVSGSGMVPGVSAPGGPEVLPIRRPVPEWDGGGTPAEVS